MDTVIAGGGAGEGGRQRRRCRRLREGGRRSLWEEGCCRGGAVLQVWGGGSPFGRDLGVPCKDNTLTPPHSPLSGAACRQKEKEQMEMLRKHHEEEIGHHRKEIERLQKEIDRHKGKIRKLKHDD